MLDDPIITFSPAFACQCPRALKVLVTATAVGLLTGFLGVGGGFLVVPALVLALALPMGYAAGTSLVVITLTSASALAVRAGVGTAPDWGVVLALTAASVVGGLLGARLAARADTTRLSAAFTVARARRRRLHRRPRPTRPRLTRSPRRTTESPHPEGEPMCRAVKCKTCGKTTWSGCGQHVARSRPASRPATGAPGTPRPPAKVAACSAGSSAGPELRLVRPARAALTTGGATH